MPPSRTRPPKLGAIPTRCSSATSPRRSCGATKAEAEDKMALINKLPLEIDALSLLAEALNYDFASKGLDEPLTIRRTRGHAGHSGHPGRRAQDVGQEQSERARLRHLLRARPGTRCHRRRAEGDRRQTGRDVRRAGLRRFRHCGDHRAGLLRRLRETHRAGAAAPRAVPQGLCRQDAARESGPEAPGRRRMENQAARSRRNKKGQDHALAEIHRRREDLLGHRRGRQRHRGQRRSLRRMAAHARNRTRWQRSRSNCR